MALGGRIRVLRLEDVGDERGSVWTLPVELLDRLGSIRNVHLTTCRPGCVRGNHYHSRQHELIVVAGPDEWELYYSAGSQEVPEVRRFAGGRAVLIDVEPGAPHAIRNTGANDLTVLSCTDVLYHPKEPDVTRCILI